MHNINHHGAAAPGLAAPERPIDACPAPLGAAADRGDLVDPQKAAPTDEVGAAGDHGRTESTQIVAEASDLGKRFATLTALLALKGFSLHELAGGGFLIARWDRTVRMSAAGEASQ